MKKIIYTIGILVMINSAAISQITVGAKTGIYVSNASVDGLINGLLPDTKVMIGSSSGLVVDVPLGSGFSFAPELLYTQKGFALREGTSVNILGIDIPLGASIENRINYIETPLLMKYGVRVNDKLGIHLAGGPSIGFATSASTTTSATVLFDIELNTTDLDLSNDRYNRTDLAGVIGAGASYKVGTNGMLFADARYQHSFNDIIQDTFIDVQIKNRGMGITAGYAMTF